MYLILHEMQGNETNNCHLCLTVHYCTLLAVTEVSRFFKICINNSFALISNISAYISKMNQFTSFYRHAKRFGVLLNTKIGNLNK